MSRPTNDRHDELFRAFYTRTPPAWLDRRNLDRFQLESERRLLDLMRGFAAGFPKSAVYADARHGEAVIAHLGRTFLDVAPHTKTIAQAVAGASLALAPSLGDAPLADLIRYEALQHADLRVDYNGPLRPALRTAFGLPRRYSLVSLSHDIAAMTSYLDYLITSAAPRAWIARYVPPPRSLSLAVFRSGERIKAVDVTAFIRTERAA